MPERGSMEDKRNQVRGIFDDIAPGYDMANRLMSMGRDRRWREIVAARCELAEGGRALDLCCGTGELGRALAGRSRGGRVVGLDSSREMLEIAKAKAAASAFASALDFVEADATALPFPDGSFDATAVGWGLRNVPDLDATLGDGGHALALLEAEPGARLLGCDRDPAALECADERLARFGNRVMLRHAAFSELPAAHLDAGGEPFTGALFDFGLSSRQIDDPARGISFMHEGPLDMRMDPSSGEPLVARLARAEASDVALALREHGDVRGAHRLARALVNAAVAGELETTRHLAALVGRVLADSRPKALAPVFQALRDRKSTRLNSSH